MKRTLNTIDYLAETEQLARIAKALGHPTRLKILIYLENQSCCFTGDLMEVIPLAQSTISQHLKELKNAGLIKGNIDGASICYCVDTDVLQKANDILSKVLSASIQTPTTCC